MNPDTIKDRLNSSTLRKKEANEINVTRYMTYFSSVSESPNPN